MNDRRWKIALGVSLAGNLFLLGLMAGGLLQGDRRPGEESRSGGPGGRFAAVAEQLDPADAQALRALMQRRSETAEPRVLAIRAARREVEAVMRSPDFTPAAAGAAVARVRTEEAALRHELDTALIAFAAGLEPEERAALVPLLRKGGGGWRGHPQEQRRQDDRR